MRIVRSSESTGAANALPGQANPGVEKQASNVLRCCEALLITLACPALGCAFHARDPFLLDASFPWLAFAPLLVAIQHGLTFGLGSAALLVVGAWAHSGIGAASGAELGGAQLSAAALQALAPWGTGCLLAAAVAGHFRDRSQSAIATLRRRYAEAAGRLSRLELAHRITRLSHARLEERLGAERWSLDSGVLEAARQMATLSEMKELGRVALDVLANHALVQSASLFVPGQGKLITTADGNLTLQSRWFGASTGQALEAAPLVALGGDRYPRSTHPLVAAAWVTRRLQAVTSAIDEPAALEGSSDLTVLAAVPLLGLEGRLLGVIAITDMPFIAFQTEHLKCLALLTAELGLLIEQRLENDPIALEDDLADDEEAFDLARKKSGLYRISASPAPPAIAWQSQSRKNRS